MTGIFKSVLLAATVLRCGQYFTPSFIRTAFLLLSLSLGICGQALAQSKSSALLHEADVVRSANPAKFAELLERAQAQEQSFSVAEKELFNYLQAWKTAYTGHSTEAIVLFKRTIATATDLNLALRARASLLNVLLIAKRPEEAFLELAPMQDLLPKATDAQAIDQGLMTAALMHILVAQYDLGIAYTDRVMKSSHDPATLCKAGQVKVDALYRSKQLPASIEFVQQVLNQCETAGEAIFANFVRISLARSLLDSGDAKAAMSLLQAHREAALATRYPRLISDYQAATALVLLQLNRLTEARDAAGMAVRESTKDEYSEPLVNAYRVLYQVASKLQDLAAALHFHELYAAADKGYLTEFSARQMAFQLVMQQTQSAKTENEALNKQNKVLQLQDQLKGKTVEAFRLYLALLLLSMAFVAFWAYKTKRLQMHFMKLSRLDSLTGLSNRPYLIETGMQLLEKAQKQNSYVALVIMDLDHFKQVNDLHGHAVGDVVLKNAVQAVLEHLGPKDIFGRLGGEEFGIVLVETNLDACIALTDRCRASVAMVRTQVKGNPLQVTASFGIASSTDSGYLWRDLVTQADVALYRAKHQGRNCVVHVAVAKPEASNDTQAESAQMQDGSLASDCA